MLVTVEDDFISEICDVPQMSTNALLFFHIFKRHNQIPVHEDKYSVWSARASLSGLEMPPAVGSLCRSGPQFIAYSNPIMLYEAAVGTSPSAPDAVNFTPVSFTLKTIFIWLTENLASVHAPKLFFPYFRLITHAFLVTECAPTLAVIPTVVPQSRSRRSLH